LRGGAHTPDQPLGMDAAIDAAVVGGRQLIM
jgi:hypothetical protein